MAAQDELADSTDWLSTPLAPLSSVESSLRCQVCKDFFTTPMITSCSHTFCSLCIRRYLAQEGKCPACRESDQEIKLRRNWAVEELVANFTTSRKNLLDFARSAVAEPAVKTLDAERPSKRRKLARQSTNGTERRTTRSQNKSNAVKSTPDTPASSPEVILDSDDGSVYAASVHESPHHANGHREPDDGLVACPCCGRRMKEALINSHLDKCIAGESHTPPEPTSSPPRQLAPPGTIAYTQTKPSKERERLPFINYSLLNDGSLRKKLRELGIPNHGSKELMRRRHTEWVNLWNANCDSLKPVTKGKLLQELRVWEDTLGRQLERAPSGFMAKDFDRDNYIKAQKGNFDDLIKQARLKRASEPAKADEVPPTDSPSGVLPDPSGSTITAGQGYMVPLNVQEPPRDVDQLPQLGEHPSLAPHDHKSLPVGSQPRPAQPPPSILPGGIHPPVSPAASIQNNQSTSF